MDVHIISVTGVSASLHAKEKRGRAFKESVSCQTRKSQFVKNRRSGPTDTWGGYPFRSDIKGMSLKPVIV